MTTLFSVRQLTVLSLFFMIFGPRVLYAIPRGDGFGAEDRYAARQIASENKKVRVEGELACTSGETAGNTTEGNPTHNVDCALNIKESRTGKTYRLSGNNESARKLFQNGKTNVAVEGTVSNGATLNVQTTQAL